LTKENWTIRYLSDSAYWLYLAHLPLVISTQILIQNWPGPAVVKCLLLTLAITGFLLLIYDKLVRYRWLGTLLNGSRTRRYPSVPHGSAPETRPSLLPEQNSMNP
jgi:peptidoglycan/LPS O-acetylase OafA/YrhL